jgi:hypothetical protein
VTDGEGSRPTMPTAGGRTFADAAHAEVVPTLLWAADPKRNFPSSVVCACYRALGRLARDGAEVELLMSAATKAGTDINENESAIIGLGLLRRTAPDHRLDEATLARVRRTLLLALDHAGLATRARSLAALSLGLLADQGGPSPDPIARDLWERIGSGYASDEIPVSILRALSRWGPDTLDDSVREGMRRLALTGYVGRARFGSAARAHAMLSFACSETAPTPSILLATLLSQRLPDGPRLGALVALGVRAPALPPALRMEAVRRIGDVMGKEPSRSPYGPAGFLALARLAAADLDAESGLVLEESHVGDLLLAGLSDASLEMRPYAMLGLAIAGRRTPKSMEVRAYHEFRVKALKALRVLAHAEAGAPEARGAYLVALGLLGDEDSIGLLCERGRDHSGPDAPRGFACESLGLVGRTSPEATSALREIAGEHHGEGWVRGKALRALARLGASGFAAQSIADELREGGAVWRMTTLAAALGECGRIEGVEPLVRTVRETATKDDVRAAACEALGRLCDPELIPSIARMGEGAVELPSNEALAVLLGHL